MDGALPRLLYPQKEDVQDPCEHHGNWALRTLAACHDRRGRALETSRHLRQLLCFNLQVLRFIRCLPGPFEEVGGIVFQERGRFLYLEIEDHTHEDCLGQRTGDEVTHLLGDDGPDGRDQEIRHAVEALGAGIGGVRAQGGPDPVGHFG